MKIKASALLTFLFLTAAYEVKAAPANVDFTVTMSEAANVTGCPANCPRIAVTVDGQTRYAEYSAGTGSSSLTFSYAPTIGDLDLDGVTLTSPIDLNGGTITDLNGNSITPLTYTVPDTSGIKIDYPSLSMDFTNGTGGRYTLNGTAYNDLSSFLTATGGTYTRASVGTYFDSTGTLQTAAANQPRFDYDPVTHAPKGILIEEQRTNLLTNGQGAGASGVTNPSGWNIDQAFGGIQPSLKNSGIDSQGYGYFEFTINGTTTLPNRLLVNPASARINILANTPYTLSYNVELTNGIYPYGIQASIAWYDASNNVLSSNYGYARHTVGSKIRQSDTVTSPASAAKMRIWFDFIDYGAPNIGSNENFTIRLSGIQLEQGRFPTSYIPTTSSAVTRQTDTLTIPTSGWTGSFIGTLMAQSVIPYLGASTRYPGIAAMDDGSISNAIHFLIGDPGGDEKAASMHYGGISNYSFLSNAYIVGNILKQCLAYSGTSTNAAQDGVLGTSAEALSIPNLTTLRVGNRRGGVDPLNGWVQTTKYYPFRVSDAQLQLLTQ